MRGGDNHPPHPNYGLLARYVMASPKQCLSGGCCNTSEKCEDDSAGPTPALENQGAQKKLPVTPGKRKLKLVLVNLGQQGKAK